MFDHSAFRKAVVKQIIGDQSLRDAAKGTGVDFSTLSRIRAGRPARLPTILKLCRAMGVSPATFFSGD